MMISLIDSLASTPRPFSSSLRSLSAPNSLLETPYRVGALRTSPIRTGRTRTPSAGSATHSTSPSSAHPDQLDDSWKQRQMISYYQWVPLIFLSMALLATLPAMLWRFLNSGLELTSPVSWIPAMMCQRATYVEIREKTVRYMVNQIDRYLLAQRDYRKGCCVQCKHMMAKYCFLFGGKRHGNYLTVAYLVIKVLYLANAIGQLFLLDTF